ncbi:MAG: LysM peptidoglycan-binding domain-containing protein [Chloroflexi bacterium]|nr:LysM peptidoglycan-binding domain-containing protein [Chloroflexota bacterium]
MPLLSLTATVALGPLLAGVTMAADPAVVVRPGDTLTAISKRHGIAIAELVELNDLSDPNRIYAGQRLQLRSQPSSARPPAPPRPAANAAPSERSHIVRSGEHLTGIARHYAVSIGAIAAANRLANPSRIFAGQRLVIPGAVTTPATSRPGPAPAPSAAKPNAPAAARTHTVRSGEHLTGIARRYAVSVSAIVRANGIANPSRIHAGQRLAIPGAAAQTDTRQATVPASMRAVMERRDGVRRVIVEEARRYDVPAALALAVAWQESGWQQGVVSHAGAIGVMQLLPATGAWVGEAMLGARVDLRDTRQNVRAGVRLLAHYLDRYRGNVDLVLAAYYQGQTGADRHGVYPVSRRYLASIKTLVTLFGD